MKREQIALLRIDELRPLVMRALEIADWPVAGMIFERYKVENRVNLNKPVYSFTVWGPKNRANGAGIDADPLTEIFRALVDMHLNQAEWDNSIKKPQ